MRAQNLFYFVDEDTNPKFAGSFNERDRAEVYECVVVRFLRNGDQPSPFPEGRRGFVGPYGAESIIYFLNCGGGPEGHKVVRDSTHARGGLPLAVLKC